jgi:hypothetical protein
VCSVALFSAAALAIRAGQSGAVTLFWTSIGALVYVYVAYPAVLALFSVVGRRPARLATDRAVRCACSWPPTTKPR